MKYAYFLCIWYYSAMRILGIDPGYERCGFGVIEGGKALAYGVITTPKGRLRIG